MDVDTKTIEEIKQIVDSKRPKNKYTKEDRIKNLQLAREKKAIKTKEPIIIEQEPDQL